VKEVKEHLKRKAVESIKSAEREEQSAAEYTEAAAIATKNADYCRRAAAEYQRLADAQPE
jgi:hypothetical protein